MTTLLPSVLSVLELFKGPLASVRFADVDAEGLATLAADVQSAALDVESQEAKLAELRQNLAQRQESLLVLAQRALAYARVYAENNDELSEELNQISLPRAQKPRKQATPKSSSAVSATALAQPEGSSLEAVPLATSSEGLDDEAALDLERARQTDVELAAQPIRAESPVAASGRKGKRGPLRTAREANAASE